MIRLSVIVPVYNAEKTLAKCIESVVRAAPEDVELLLIDDGSTDGSGRICDAYAEKFTCIKCVHKPNGGVSSARNAGLDRAGGTYVTFLDADDSLADGAVEALLKPCPADLVIFAFESSKTEGIWESDVLVKEDTILSREKINSFFRSEKIRFCWFPWAKRFHRELIGEQRFDEAMRIGEDNRFNFEYLNKCKSVCLAAACVYRYDESMFHWSKYFQSAEESLYCLDRILSEYFATGISYPRYERALWFNYKDLCRREIDQNPDVWYRNPAALRIYGAIKNSFPWTYRCEFFLLRFPVLRPLHPVFKRLARLFKR